MNIYDLHEFSDIIGTEPGHAKIDENEFNNDKNGKVKKNMQKENIQKYVEDSYSNSENIHPPKMQCPMKPLALNNVTTSNVTSDTLHQSAYKTHCTGSRCTGSVMYPFGGEAGPKPVPGEMRPKEQTKEEAINFMKQYYASLGGENSENHVNRLSEVLREIDATGIYDMEEKELMFGARLAWRNAPRCIGRIQWKKLQLFDCRHVKTAREMFECILTHLKYATNNGKLRSAISIFPPRSARRKDFRVWNSQLVRYAGYEQLDGTILGDPASLEITQIAKELGWEGKGTQFDVLPLILQANGETPEFFEIPPDYILEVPITHPKYRELDDLNLKWYTLPAVSNIALDCGGLEFTAAPFNGWYMATEIGARNFADKNRYNLLKPVAERLGLDTSNNVTLWRDTAVLELTQAVLYSFNEAGVTIVDHHTASESFMKHLKDEQKLRGGCPADWVWIVPPISGAATRVFHQEMLNYKLKPSYEYQTDPWKYFSLKPDSLKRKKKLTFKGIVSAIKVANLLFGDVLSKRHKVTILYATETGKSEEYATKLNELFLHGFNSKIVCMEDYNFAEIENEQCLFIVASTFGNGEAPDNGESFERKLRQTVDSNVCKIEVKNLDMGTSSIFSFTADKLSHLRYSVFALGSRAYPTFCAFGKLLNDYLKKLGSEEIHSLGEGDELDGQEESFRVWARNCFKNACERFCITDVKISAPSMEIWTSVTDWEDGRFKIEKVDEKSDVAVIKALSKLHRRKITSARVISVQNLQAVESSRVTNLVKLDISGCENVNYQPGDHLCVYPCNNKQLVEGLLDRMQSGFEADTRICVKRKDDNAEWIPITNVPMPSSLREIFTNYLDITTPPSAKLLSLFANACKSLNEKEQLNFLAKNCQYYESWKRKKFSNILEVLIEFPSAEVDVTMLINQLPILKPRFYSISSSPRKHPQEIHLTVALVSYMIDQKTEHRGVCSSWLNSLSKGDIVPCLIRSAPKFRLPKDPSIPVILVGPGTGIAPFRSFWQERSCEDGNEHSNMYLFFGCRNSKLDNIYEEDKKELLQKGIFKKVFNAFSREANFPKTYVQDLLQENASEIIELIVRNGGHVYVCGDVTMASAVNITFIELIKTFAALTNEEAKKFVHTMKSDGRYHEDIFGTTLKYGAEEASRLRMKSVD